MSRPNIIVILCDQLKATASHLYGSAFCETPNLERLAREGALFDRAYTSHPLCVPARISLWTGQYSHTHGCQQNQTLMPPDAPHAFKQWKAMGYTTALIGKNHCFQTPEDLARFDVWCETVHRGPRKEKPRGMAWVADLTQAIQAYADAIAATPQSPRFAYAVTDHPETCYSTGLLTEQARRFIEERGQDPFVLWLSYPDPHEPYVAPKKYIDRIPEDAPLPPLRAHEFSGPEVPERAKVLYEILGMEDDNEEEIRNQMRVYHANVKFIDDCVGRLLDALEEQGVRENTLVVFTSDHGDFAAEHNMTCKGGVFYDCLTRIPLILSGPGIPEGTRDGSMANLVDIVPTLYHLSGIQIPEYMQGLPLPSITDQAPRTETFSEYGCGGEPFTLADLALLDPPQGRHALGQSLHQREAQGVARMVCTRDWKYVHDSSGGGDELYDLRHDPAELHNLILAPTHAKIIADLRSRLLAWGG